MSDSDKDEKKSATSNMRRLKWLGHPPKWYEGTDTVADWEYERTRVIPVIQRSSRVIGPEHLPTLTQEYIWTRQNDSRILDVKPADAKRILDDNPLEFYDVTDMSEKDALAFQHEPIYVPRPDQG